MNTENNDQVVYLYLDDIIPNRFQPREVFDEKSLKELALSIKEHGVIQPIIVRNVKGKYEIIAGERRYKASALAGLTKIPAIIRNLDDKESSKVALLENLQRKNLTPIEEARTYQKILEIDEMTQEDLAKTMGKSQSAVANKLRLLSLPDEIQNALLKEKISERHARTLLEIPEASKQIEMLKIIMEKKLSVRALEEEIKNLHIMTEEREKMPVQIENNEEVSLQPQEVTSPIIKNVSNPEVADKFAMFDSEENDDLDGDDTIPPLLFAPQSTINSNPFLSSTTTPKKPVEKSLADLDDLLKIKQPEPLAMSKIEKPIENGSNINNNDNFIVEDLPLPRLSTSSLRPIESPPRIISPEVVNNTVNSNQLELPPINNNVIYTPISARQKIKDIVSDFNDKGISISLEEMDFENTYQIIIKIDK